MKTSELTMEQRPIGLQEMNKMADYRSESVVITADLLESVDEVEAYFQFVQYENPQVLPISFTAVRHLINEREVRGTVSHVRFLNGRRTGRFHLIVEHTIDTKKISGMKWICSWKHEGWLPQGQKRTHDLVFPTKKKALAHAKLCLNSGWAMSDIPFVNSVRVAKIGNGLAYCEDLSHDDFPNSPWDHDFGIKRGNFMRYLRHSKLQRKRK